MKIKIRDAKTTDAAILDNMLTKLVHYEAKWDSNINSQYAAENNYGNMIDQPGCKLIVAEVNDEIVGYLCGFIVQMPTQKKPTAILDAIYVDEHCRNMGCASAMINEFKLFALNEGAVTIELKVFSNNEPANKLYSKMMFEENKKYLRFVL